ncbi:hypothetical protein SAY87_030555 [Trapa incisa]|uniref:Expansin-like EG45 domain-containing protein n=1 Tax=Trapa incisa TaxID=236973 RepID=A0AAN7KIX2_9MYRT|nr:hypothetical protein SAY87_030555 [Trapa incisa]
MKLLQSSKFLLLILYLSATLARGDVGRAAYYSPPYIPTACNGIDPSQFPSNNLFAAAGEGIWDNGAACGRRYLVRCISATVFGTCKLGQTIQVTIVDRAYRAVSRPSSNDATIVLSTTAFENIARAAAWVNIEYVQV